MSRAYLDHPIEVCHFEICVEAAGSGSEPNDPAVDEVPDRNAWGLVSSSFSWVHVSC